LRNGFLAANDPIAPPLMPLEDIEFYHARKHGAVLPPVLVRQLAALARRVLVLDGRESSYVDENNRFLTGKIARLDTMALIEDKQNVDCFLNRVGRRRPLQAQSEATTPVLLRG
jgi:hypothetical protein